MRRRRLHTFCFLRPFAPLRLCGKLVAVLLAILLLSSTTSFACGPFTLEAVFVFTVHPDYPLQRFAAGRIGVVQPSYARSYLYVAYRYLTGSSFTPTEQNALTQLWKDRLEFGWSPGDEDWIKAWLTARRKVVAQDPAPISVYRNREKPNEYESYLNCQKDAFDNAIATLNERIAKYGAENSAVKNWLAAQDEVFSNCGGGSVIPAQLPAGTDALLRTDRSYQIAAANFYSEKFDEAKKEFEAIAGDSKSPWQRNALYLIARTLLRKASLGPPEQRQQSLVQAESQLQKILADKNHSALHGASLRLLNLVRLRLRPAERLHELAGILTAKSPNENLKQDLWDYTVLLDTFLEGDEAKPRDAVKGDDLSDWIATFQKSDEESRNHSLARWQATHANTWLIASLSKVEGKHPKAGELISAALKLSNNSPAFTSARFHAIRLLTETGKDAEARALLGELLKTEHAQFDQSTLNLLTGQRMLLASNLSDFLSDAARVPATLSWNDDGREIPTEDSEVSPETKAMRGKPLFPEDAGYALNNYFPLAVLKEAAKSDRLPVSLRLDVAQAAWLRAALLGDTKTADELAPIVTKLVPGLSGLLNDYVSATQPEQKKFAAIYAWLKFPGLEPVVDVGMSRQTPLNQQDTYRDNWWCRSSYTPVTSSEAEAGRQSFTSDSRTPPRFLSFPELERAGQELTKLKALGAAPNYISREVIQWATHNPNDARVPEALHLAVNTTRYGCPNDETGRWSKAAFDFLHRKYPNNPWAKKTPYWFKN